MPDEELCAVPSVGPYERYIPTPEDLEREKQSRDHYSREECLRQAVIATGGRTLPPEEIVKFAAVFYTFVKGTENV